LAGKVTQHRHRTQNLPRGSFERNGLFSSAMISTAMIWP
jgi:hypothetical protein